MKVAFGIFCLALLLSYCFCSIALRQYFAEESCTGNPILAELNPYWQCPPTPFCNQTSPGFAQSSSYQCINRISDYSPPKTSKYTITSFYTGGCSTPSAVNYIMANTCLKNQKDPNQFFKATCNADGTVTSHLNCTQGCTSCNLTIPMLSYCKPNVGGAIWSCKPGMFIQQLELKGL